MEKNGNEKESRPLLIYSTGSISNMSVTKIESLIQVHRLRAKALLESKVGSVLDVSFFFSIY